MTATKSNLGMGNCCRNGNRIESKMEEQNIKNMLLLGIGSSGKTTILKQLSLLWNNNKYMNEYIERHNKYYIGIIKRSVIDHIKTILFLSERLYAIRYKKCNPDLKMENILQDNVSLMNDMERFVEIILNSVYIRYAEFDEVMSSFNFGEIIAEFWKLNFVQETYKYRYNRYFWCECIPYFIENGKRIFQENYKLSNEDILKMYSETSYMSRETIAIPQRNNKCSRFNITDIGGKRDRRKGWNIYFRDIDILVFVVALNHYSDCLQYGTSSNASAIHESILVFNYVVNHKHFHDSNIILLFTGKDLFRERLKKGYNLDISFTDKEYWNDDQIQWNVKDNYAPNNSNQLNSYKANDAVYGYIREYWDTFIPKDIIHIIGSYYENTMFEECYNKSIQFIKNIYLSKSQNKIKHIYTYVINALDTNQVRDTFQDIITNCDHT